MKCFDGNMNDETNERGNELCTSTKNNMPRDNLEFLPVKV